MSYFPSDIPFMSEDELKENGIKIPKDAKDKRFPIDAYIYKLDLNVGKPVVEKFPAQIREGAYGDEVIRWIGPNDYSVWHSEFDTRMLGVVYEPLDNVVELIVRRDDPDSNMVRRIKDYLDSRIIPVGKRLESLYRGYSSLAVYIIKEIKSGGETNELKQN